MNIAVDGIPDGRELKEAASFFADVLMHKNLSRNIHLDIEVRNEGFEPQGQCYCDDIEKNPRFFTIVLANDDQIISSLAHEMVHLKQYAKNELKELFCVASRGVSIGTARWMGKVWKPQKNEDPYWDSPWEREAYGLDPALTYKWETRNDSSKPWYVGRK